MRKTLEDWECTVITATSQEQAFVHLRQHGSMPDAIISDYRLREDKTGAQAITAIRNMYNTDIPALIITGDTAPERLKEAQATGIALLHKPVQPSQILGFVRQCALKVQKQTNSNTITTQ